MTLSMGLFVIGILALYYLSTSIFNQQDQTLAQQSIPTIKYRNLVIVLGNGVKTNAQLTYPAVGKGSFPGVIGVNLTVLNTNVWGNATVNDLIHDAEKALNVLRVQPEVDPNRISIIGHSEGTIIAPRVAIDNATIVENIILMGTVAQNTRGLVHYQLVDLPSEYATQVLDKNHTGLISIQQIAKDPVLGGLSVPYSVLRTNNTKAITNSLVKEFGTNDSISIDKQLKPLLIKDYENTTAFNSLKCNNIEGCPVWLRSHFSLKPTLSIIGNVSKTTGILILNGENDSQTPVQQAFLLQQRLTEVKHPDHILITYPNLGHTFSPSQWLTKAGPIERYVLADLYRWLETHSGLSQSYVTTSTTSTIGAGRLSLRVFCIYLILAAVSSFVIKGLNQICKHRDIVWIGISYRYR